MAHKQNDPYDKANLNYRSAHLTAEDWAIHISASTVRRKAWVDEIIRERFCTDANIMLEHTCFTGTPIDANGE